MNWAANRATKGLGSSFRGVSAYLLTPKEEGQTLKERVAFTACLNLATDDPTRAWRLMAETAIRRDELKLLAGGSLAGRKPAEGAFKPVFHYALAWHPDQNPSPSEMEQAAIGTLKALKLDHHEALLVAHGDEGHAHLHVVVNRVDPDTGKLNPLSNAFRKLDRWAAEYERETGEIVSPNREAKHRAIDEGRPRPERQRWLPYEEYTQARQAARETAHQAGQDPAEGRPRSRWQGERDGLWDSQQAASKDMLEAAKLRAREMAQALREKQRPGWQELGRGQASCQRELAQALRGNHSDVAAFINRHNELLQKAWPDPEERRAQWPTLLTRGGLERAVTAAQAFETLEFKRDVTHDRHAMQRAFWADYRTEVDQLRQGQKAERETLRDQQRERLAERVTTTGIEGAVPDTAVPGGRKPGMVQPTPAAKSGPANLRVDRPSRSEVFPLGKAGQAKPPSSPTRPATPQLRLDPLELVRIPARAVVAAVVVIVARLMSSAWPPGGQSVWRRRRVHGPADRAGSTSIIRSIRPTGTGSPHHRGPRRWGAARGQCRYCRRADRVDPGRTLPWRDRHDRRCRRWPGLGARAR